jgi:hypothetical protein
MIHFAHAPVDFPAVMCPIGFPVHTRRAPNRTAIALAYEDILSIMLVKATRRLIDSCRCGYCRLRHISKALGMAIMLDAIVWGLLRLLSWAIPGMPRFAPACAPLSWLPQVMTFYRRTTVAGSLWSTCPLIFRVPLWTPLHVSRVCCHCIEQSKIGCGEKQ